MNDSPQGATRAEEPLVITKDEANSSHVDSLIKRQMSLRGEGVTAERSRRWYYQNWLLFMIVGAVFAACGWLLIEPWFDDFHYTQGVIQSIDRDAVFPADLIPGRDSSVPREIFASGTVTVRDQKVWLFSLLKEVKDGRARDFFDPAGLKVGQEVGLFTHYAQGPREDIAVAHFIDVHPAAPASKAATRPLRDQEQSSRTAGFLLFSVVAALIGLGVGAADGIVCRLPRRALLGGGTGLLVGAVGALFMSVVAGAVYTPLNILAESQLESLTPTGRASGFLIQMIARMLAWGFAGTAMGLGQGVALRSKRLLTYGFLGGTIGGLLGGMLFDPLDFIILGRDTVGAETSRAIGVIVIGAAVGAMIGVVELLTRDSWLRMTEGPLAGKEFLIFRDTMNIGASPKSEIYLFNDPAVAATHATLRIIGDETEIASRDKIHPLMVNRNVVSTARLRHGDSIRIGATSFVFEQRQR